MEIFSLSGITVTTIHDKRRIKSNSLYPVKYRVTFHRKQVYYPSGIDLSVDEWSRVPTTKEKELRSQRELIQAGFETIKGHIKDLVLRNDFSFDQLNARLSRGIKNSIISAFYYKIDILSRNGQVGTSEWYLYSLKSILKYTDKELKFSEITIDWLKKYEAHLLEKEKSYTTISMYMRALQAILNEGKKQGLISNFQYPFGKDKYEIPEENGRKMALTLAQIGDVMKFHLTSDTEKKCRDLWFFSYLTNGINIADLLHLKYSNIENGNIRYIRQKTINKSRKKREIVAVLLPEMRQIIDRWGNSDKNPDSYIFPYLIKRMSPAEERKIIKNCTRLINKKMGVIGKALGIGNISTYTARHSFATVLKRSGTNIAFISEALGHADLRTTENYLDSFEDETRIRNAAELTKF